MFRKIRKCFPFALVRIQRNGLRYSLKFHCCNRSNEMQLNFFRIHEAHQIMMMSHFTLNIHTLWSRKQFKCPFLMIWRRFASHSKTYLTRSEFAWKKLAIDRIPKIFGSTNNFTMRIRCRGKNQLMLRCQYLESTHKVYSTGLLFFHR